ncbi:TIGR04086 family membrane protein [Mediterraneibacter agrestimuris]|uniref:TIGR04086 family membrane protein n=1 Tax=Mediterraneibacter agrestimuris TaxID=2941333 RepID=UPI002040EE4A|nr:TIGR04086 family membrane protein [Mediterraneibacter agrestimuris]
MRSAENKVSHAGAGNQISKILRSLLCAFVLTGILLLVLAGLLYKLSLDEGKVTAGIILIYVLSTFVGGFIAGKLLKERKFLWGLTVGILYFGLLMLVSLGLYRSLQGGGADILTTFFLCAGGGMLGGMLS